MGEPTNEDRAGWAAAALEAFMGSHEPDDEKTSIEDLIVNLLHLAHQQYDLKLEEVEEYLARRRRMFEMEVEEDD